MLDSDFRSWENVDPRNLNSRHSVVENGDGPMTTVSLEVQSFWVFFVKTLPLIVEFST